MCKDCEYYKGKCRGMQFWQLSFSKERDKLVERLADQEEELCKLTKELAQCRKLLKKRDAEIEKLFTDYLANIENLSKYVRKHGFIHED